MRYPVSAAATEIIDGRTAYCFSAAVPAKEMQRKVTLKVFDGQGNAVTLLLHSEDITAEGFSCSVEDYLDKAIATVDSAKLLELAYAMRDYGSCAQLHFDYDTDNRAAVRDSVSQVSAADLAAYEGSKTEAENAPVRFSGVSLLLRSNTVMRFYFQVKSGSVEDCTITLDGETVTPVQSGAYWYVEKSGIVARDLDTAVTVQVEQDGEQLFEGSYSPLSYAYKVLGEDNDANLQLLMKALFRYWQAAEDFFA